ncbi:MAG: DUF3592 domain-containing protein [Ruminococcus sp.]|nr:DUF3592 domain-containing protein [Ruminococcus sp.]
MKVEKIDYVWAVLSLVTVALTFSKGCLSIGVIIIYAMMVSVFLYHINTVKQQISGTTETLGVIKDYHTSEKTKLYYPIVTYETEEGRTVTSVCSFGDTERRYETGSTEVVRYDPLDPMFFYFAEREDELISPYKNYIIFGGIIAVILFLVVRAMFGG